MLITPNKARTLVLRELKVVQKDSQRAIRRAIKSQAGKLKTGDKLVVKVVYEREFVTRVVASRRMIPIDPVWDADKPEDSMAQLQRALTHWCKQARWEVNWKADCTYNADSGKVNFKLTLKPVA